MNFLLNAYSFYKEINPSTLTGAIDVIVVRDGDELRCSPIHVRFGKWQVLRPAEKRVKVSVNGRPIPFDMKIGDAGEAFFVFETDDDVPDDLITSPLLLPQDESNADNTAVDAAKQTGRFGARKADDDMENADVVTGTEGQDIAAEQAEPTFLDLDSTSTPPSSSYYDTPSTAKPPETARHPDLSRNRPPLSPSYDSPQPLISGIQQNSVEAEQDRRVDEALKKAAAQVHLPDVRYSHDMALDAEGYHSPAEASYRHEKDESEDTVTGDDVPSGIAFPRAGSEPPLHEYDEYENYLRRQFKELAIDRSQTPTQSQSNSPAKKSAATGLGLDLSSLPDQEYSWEWGAFPQPSPMKSTFPVGTSKDAATWGKSRFSRKGKDRLFDPLPEAADEISIVVEDPKSRFKGDHHRSSSVPPNLEESPTRRKRDRKTSANYDQDSFISTSNPHKLAESVGYGYGGQITASKSDPTLFVVNIEGRSTTFELSIADIASQNGDNVDIKSLFDGRDEVEAARLFAKDKVDYLRFLSDEELLQDSRLVLRWAGDHYITRFDDSPLLSALGIWRAEAVRRRASGISSPRPESPSSEFSRPVSPSSDEDESAKSGMETETTPPTSVYDDGDDGINKDSVRSKSEPPEDTKGPKSKPTSSSWVQWWSRSRKSKANVTNQDRAQFKAAASAPETSDEPLASASLSLPETKGKFIYPVESAPAFPSTPVEEVKHTVNTLNEANGGEDSKRRYAKTLRLSSDQLKTLNLKPGANTITFSLSATGAIACTARMFVWDSSDLVLISDIDGTITKSDGLGHVFAMIGRDWTHMGVAKLYTDIARNGYKILYLTSRAIGQADATRGYLQGIKQNNYQLPEGPVIMSPDRLMASLHREVIMRKPEVFKMACLRDIQRLFGEVYRNPFYAGFGNRITDALSYRSVNVPSSRIFTIDSTGEVKLELLELAGYKSSYIHMTDLVDQMFPPIHRKWAAEFTDFNYWKQPVQEFPLPDFSPPSPALSARSDTSNQSALSRLRNFSLVGTRQSNVPKSITEAIPIPGRSNSTRSSPEPESHGSYPSKTRSTSPASFASSSISYISDDEDSTDDMEAELRRRRRRERTTSLSSMPGSLDQFAIDGGGEGGEYEEDLDQDEDAPMTEDEEQAAEEAFDEDLLAAGEMKNVPFL